MAALVVAARYGGNSCDVSICIQRPRRLTSFTSNDRFAVSPDYNPVHTWTGRVNTRSDVAHAVCTYRCKCYRELSSAIITRSRSLGPREPRFNTAVETNIYLHVTETDAHARERKKTCSPIPLLVEKPLVSRSLPVCVSYQYSLFPEDVQIVIIANDRKGTCRRSADEIANNLVLSFARRPTRGADRGPPQFSVCAALSRARGPKIWQIFLLLSPPPLPRRDASDDGRGSGRSNIRLLLFRLSLLPLWLNATD